MEKLLTLAIPTNGIIQWVFPVLESIYNQGIDSNRFEVVITDNGDNEEFYYKILEFKKQHDNLIYKKTNAYMFENQIEAFKIAHGTFIKFINHRTRLIPEALDYLLTYVEKNSKEKPVTFFLNGAGDIKVKNKYYNDFDNFIYGISHYASWSGGISCWKQDIEKIISSYTIQHSIFFPHTCFVFNSDSYRKYNIDNKKIFSELSTDISIKGKYDLFYAFGVDFINLIKELFDEKLIAKDTYNNILSENEKFIIKLYGDYVFLRKKCSYDLTSRKESLNVYYSYNKIKLKAIGYLLKKILDKISL